VQNLDEYIGIPFDTKGKTRQGCDCYRLICLVYKDRLGIELPDYPDVEINETVESLLKITRLMKHNRDNWLKVEKPEPFDVILIRTGSMLYHAGLVIDKYRMLHIDRGINSTIERFDSLMWKDKVEGFYRYAK
jgi:cell wall-associated NlpC family hydrolase